MQAFQDYYPDNVAHCYGCGKSNPDGHQIKTYWDGDETVTRYTPRPEHTAIPGYVYGGLLAFTLSIDDYVVTYFVKGPGADTLPTLVSSAWAISSL